MNELMKHQTRKRDQMKTSQSGRKPLIITDQPSKTGGPRERAFHDPASGQQDKPTLGFWQLDDLQADALFGSSLDRCRTGVALIDEGDLNGFASRFLHRLCQLTHLGTILSIGWRDQQTEQMPQGIHRNMDLAAFAALGPIVACPMATFRRRLQRSAIQNGRAGLAFPPIEPTQQEAQVMDDR